MLMKGKKTVEFRLIDSDEMPPVVIKENEREPKTPEQLKKLVEKNRFTGYYKTKKRFIN